MGNFVNTLNVSTMSLEGDFMIMVENSDSDPITQHYFVLDTEQAEKLFDELGTFLNQGEDEDE